MGTTYEYIFREENDWGIYVNFSKGKAIDILRDTHPLIDIASMAYMTIHVFSDKRPLDFKLLKDKGFFADHCFEATCTEFTLKPSYDFEQVF